MGLLEQLWDDTVAGPQPDSGLSRLRKYNSFSAPPRSPPPITVGDTPISRSITIVKSPNFRNLSVDTGSVPSSPAGSSAPDSPFTPRTPRGDLTKMRRKSSPEAFEKAEPRSPTVYDWVVISALDR